MKVYFVGAGPGDPELLTMKGHRLLSTADVVIYTGSLVPGELLSVCSEEAVILNSAGMTLEEVSSVYRSYKDNEGVFVRLHTGDPSIYGAIQEQIDFLRGEKIAFEIVPGVSSFQAAAASLEQQLTLAGVSQSIILTRLSGRTKVPESEDLSVLGKSKATIVLFLSVDRPEVIMEKLLPHYGYSAPVAVVYRAGWPDETIARGKLGELNKLVKDNKITRQALVFIGYVLSGNYEKSKLYNPGFTHGYREGNGKDERISM